MFISGLLILLWFKGLCIFCDVYNHLQQKYKSPKKSRHLNIKSLSYKLKLFDEFDVTLGDIMRGERATQGISITDVRLDLRLKKSHIIAIEAGDLSAFDSKIFIPNYVKVYAAYLGMDPSMTFEIFCWETGFQLQVVARRSFVMRAYDNTLKFAHRISLEFSWPVRLRLIK